MLSRLKCGRGLEITELIRKRSELAVSTRVVYARGDAIARETVHVQY